MKSHLTNNIQSKASKMSVKSIHSTNNIFFLYRNNIFIIIFSLSSISYYHVSIKASFM